MQSPILSMQSPILSMQSPILNNFLQKENEMETPKAKAKVVQPRWEYVVELNQPLCECNQSWAMQHKTIYCGGRYGFTYGCSDVAVCPCGHVAILKQRYYD
jgi:hypothetical protein